MIAAGVLAAAAAQFAPWPTAERPAAPGASSLALREHVQATPADSRLAKLPAREAIGKPRGELFGPLAAPPPPAPARAQPAEPVRPTPPAINYRVAGIVLHDGVTHVALANGDRVLTLREGDTLEEGYRVESIKPDGVMLLYPRLDAHVELPVAGMKLQLDAAPPRALAGAPGAASSSGSSTEAGEARPAQLRWVGPERVQAGSNFNVALKLTSEQPVLASPMQLSFDAKLLEPVSVRPGGFFAAGSFTYRVNPGGSIFVGAASGAGSVAADADFVVVTFKPIRSGAAELKVSSLVLQGAAGRSILHEPPAAFRTAIVQ